MPHNSSADALMDDVLVQMASSQLSHRSSRHSSHTPKRRSIRVEKSRSTHASPRAADRRRTMNTAKPYPTLEDHYRQMFGTNGKDENDSTTHQPSHRPVSWHPSSARFSSSFYQSSSSESANTSHNNSSQSFHTTSDYSTLSPDQVAPNQLYAIEQLERPSPEHEDISWSSYFGNHMPVRSGPPSYSATMDEPKTWFLPEYSQASYEPPQYQTVVRNQRNNFLPIQHPPAQPIDSDMHLERAEEKEHTLSRQNSKELIGMGLYDDPETTPFNLLTGGKGLKLEESWQPPEDMINDSDDADGEDGSSDEEDEPPKPPPAPAAMLTTVYGAPQLPLMNMSGQSFLFDDADDDTITSDWWYQMKQQQNVAAQDASGLGYGWLRPS